MLNIFKSAARSGSTNELHSSEDAQERLRAIYHGEDKQNVRIRRENQKRDQSEADQDAGASNDFSLKKMASRISLKPRLLNDNTLSRFCMVGLWQIRKEKWPHHWAFGRSTMSS